MLSRRVGPSHFSAASRPSRLPSTNESHEFSALAFHRLTKPFSRKPFLLILMQTAPGVCTLTSNYAPLFSITFTHFFRTLCQDRKITSSISIVCALFGKNTGGGLSLSNQKSPCPSCLRLLSLKDE